MGVPVYRGSQLSTISFFVFMSHHPEVPDGASSEVLVRASRALADARQVRIVAPCRTRGGTDVDHRRTVRRGDPGRQHESVAGALSTGSVLDESDRRDESQL